MVAPITKYKSVFTGAEIDEAIANMKASVGGGIVNDFVTGGTNKVASAELIKTLKGIVDANDQPAHIKSQLTSIADSHLLTNTEYSKFTGLINNTASFRGSFTNAAARDAAISTEYTSYTGKEISFIADDGTGSGVSEISKWDVTSGTWKKVQFSAGSSVSQLVATTSSINLFTYNTNNAYAIKCLVQAFSSDKSQRQIQEVLLSHVGADTYISIYGEVGNSTSLFNLTSSINVSTGIVTLILTTLAANVTVTGKVIASV